MFTSTEQTYETLPLHLNTQGAECFVEGDYETAQECFQNALEALESGFCKSKDITKRLSHPSRSTCFEDRQCYVHATPFVLDYALNLKALRSAILFNLGLTLQARSLTSLDANLFLKQAMECYDECLQSLERERLLVAYPDFCLAALNNKVSIFFEIQSFHHAAKTLQLLHFMTQRDEFQQQISLPQDALTGILFNIHHASAPKIAGAA